MTAERSLYCTVQSKDLDYILADAVSSNGCRHWLPEDLGDFAPSLHAHTRIEYRLGDNHFLLNYFLHQPSYHIRYTVRGTANVQPTTAPFQP